ncbi:MAG TPA: serine/threonine-protein kinase, partial [Acidimicrobiales bacterium]|nr:serine/threonine-protein kinase [Acidimicrobiales bacterium]
MSARTEIPGYTYLRPLGAGGYAEVHLYEQQSPRRQVAIKFLSASVTSAATRRLFQAEAEAMARLAEHPHIVQVFLTDTTPDGRPFLVMQYYPLANMAERARSERLAVSEVLRVGVQLASAVETAHRAGILHRDIKPANVLTSSYGQPGLTDFGIATSANDPTEEASAVSVPWAPPELLFSGGGADVRSDVYSLGATLWHLLVRRSPFEEPGGDNSTTALMQRARSRPVPRTGRDDVPAELERVLAQAMAKAPEGRPATAVDLARMLQRVEASQGWSVSPLVLVDPDAGRRPAGDDTGERTVLR